MAQQFFEIAVHEWAHIRDYQRGQWMVEPWRRRPQTQAMILGQKKFGRLMLWTMRSLGVLLFAIKT